jgi:hypothetical protein
MRAIGIAIPFIRRSGAAIDAQAQAHFNRVIADGGLVPSGLSGVNAFFNTIKTIYGTSDINTAISVGLDPQVLGYKLGAGSGTTLGQAAQKLYSPKDVFGGIGTGNAYWEGSGVAGNYVSTPNAAANQITSDIEIIAKIDYSNSGSFQFIQSTYATSGYSIGISSSDRIYAEFKVGATNYGINSTVSIGATFSGFIKVTRTTADGIAKFFTSLDGITYTQLGANVGTAVGALVVSGTNLLIGAYLGGSPFRGKIYRATISNSIGGAPVVDFNPNQYTGANTWTSTTSEVWTVNSTGAGLADVVQTTAASQPLLLNYTGSNYLFSSGIASNNCTTSTNSSFQVNGDFTIDFNVSDLVTSGEYICKGNSTDGFTILLNAGVVRYTFFDTGVRTVDLSSAAINLVTQKWCRFQRSGINYSFYTSTDGITFTQVGSNIVDVVVTKAITAPLRIGQGVSFYASPCVMKTYRAKFYNDATQTTLIADFNPATYNAATSQTQWTSTTGEVWTINTGTASTGYKGVLVDRTIVQGDGVDDRMVSGTLASRQYFTSYSSSRIFPTTGDRPIYSGSSVSHVLYGGLGPITAYNGANLNSLITSYLLNMATVDFNSTTSKIRINTGSDVIGTTGALGLTSTTVNLFSYAAATFGNTQLNTLIQPSSLNSDAIKTAMYNYIKSINNSAF